MKEEEDLGMESLADHYERLLGLDCDWQVLDVELVLEEQRVAIRLEPVKKVARMINRHWDRILSWFRHHISNGMAEGYNSRKRVPKLCQLPDKNPLLLRQTKSPPQLHPQKCPMSLF